MVTLPVAVPGSDPIREIGSILRVSGGRGGATVSVACWLTPLELAVIVAAVVAVTAVVVTGIDADHAPAGTVKVEGTLAAGELLERLSTIPPAGAGPCRSTQAVTGVPPLTAAGVSWSDFSAAGSTVNRPEAETPLSVAVIVTGVGGVTWPSATWKSVQPWVPGIVIVAGTGTTEGFELVRVTVAPLAGTPAVSCNSTKGLVPPVTACGWSTPSSDSDTGVGGAALIVNVPVADGAVTAGDPGKVAVAGASSP